MSDLEYIDVEHFLETLSVRNLSKATEHEFRFSCPYPNHTSGDERPSCYMNVSTTAFYCHGCKERGTAVTLAAYMLTITPLEAAHLLRERYQPGGINPDDREIVKEVRAILDATPEEIIQPQLDESVLENLLVDWEAVSEAKNAPPSLNYFLERGFSPQTLNEWEFGYDRITDRPVITVRNFDGTLMGFKARAWTENQHPKYLILGDKAGRDPRYGFSCYQPSNVVFGGHRVKQEAPLVICEGELNAIAIQAKTNRQAVAINGSHFSVYHAELITALTDRAILFLDTDKAGHDAVWGWDDSKGTHHEGIVETLNLFIDVDVCPDHEGDPASMSGEEINECISEAKNWLSISIGLC